MFVKSGARQRLLKDERRRFLSEEWPSVRATIQRLGLTPEELLDDVATERAGSDAAEEES